MSKAFENDYFLAQRCVELVKNYKIRTVIETGTELGGTAKVFAATVELVLTVDIALKVIPQNYCPNIGFFIADSVTVLPTMINLGKAPFLFYLDAHTPDCPLESELIIIEKAKVEKPIIVIHDCLVPDHPEFGYDMCGEKPISFELVKPHLEQIYPDGFKTSYNEQAAGAMRGVLFAEPQ